MKHSILIFAFLFSAAGLYAQTDRTNTAAQETATVLTAKYQLDAQQQTEVLTLQERKFRNLGEIEGLQQTDPLTYSKKIRAMQYANDMAMRGLLNEQQMKIFHAQQLELRQQRAEVYKEMKAAGKQPAEIESKIIEIEAANLLQN